MKDFLDEIKNKSKFDLNYKSIENETLQIIDNYNQKNKVTVNRFHFKLVFLSILILFLTISTSVIVFKTNSKEITQINESISNLDKIENDEEKMNEIVRIDKEIMKLSDLEVININKTKLTSERNETSRRLKESVEWKDMVNYDVPYYLITDFLDIDEITNIHWSLSISSMLHTTNNYDFYKDLLALIDTAYIDMIYDDFDTFWEDYLKSDDPFAAKKNFHLTVFLKNNNWFSITIHSNGRITIYLCKRGEGEEVIGLKKYISLVTLDSNIFVDFFSYENQEKYKSV